MKIKERVPISIGINLNFYTYNLFPLYFNFWKQLGCNIIVSDELDVEGLNYEYSQLCFPMELSLQLVKKMINKRPDYIFLPAIYEMDAEQNETQRLDFNCACAFVTGEPYILKQAFKCDIPFISPSLNFANGLLKEEYKFIEAAKQIGFNDNEAIKNAYCYAVEKQKIAQRKLYEIGDNFLKELKEGYAVILLGRGYNSFATLANKGIPEKFVSRGVNVLPMDMIKHHQQHKRMYWEIGHRILSVAEMVATHKCLFACYITNYSCAPDSMLLNTFRKIMGNKPSLILELDSHSADAGINTRIDAFLDIVENYKAMQK